MNTAAACLVLTVLIAGCGKSDKPASVSSPAKAMTSGTASEKGTSAEVVAKQARGDLSCPARVATTKRADNAPVDDVLGVRPGVSYEEALNVVLCTHDLLVSAPATGRGFDLKAPGARSVRQGFSAAFAEPHVVKSSRQIMQDMQIETLARGGNAVHEDLKPGQARWFVATMGLPGRERVLSVAREERFAAEQSPTIETVMAALMKKYGTATKAQPGTSGQLPIVRWAYDPQGRLVTPDSPLFSRCSGTSDPNGGVNLSPDCGVVVQAMLVPQKTNPVLVDRMQIGVVDHGGGHQMLVATEQSLLQSDQQRQAKEVENAARNSKAPTL